MVNGLYTDKCGYRGDHSEPLTAAVIFLLTLVLITFLFQSRHQNTSVLSASVFRKLRLNFRQHLLQRRSDFLQTFSSFIIESKKSNCAYADESLTERWFVFSLAEPGGSGSSLRHPGPRLQEQHCQHHEAVVCEGPLWFQPQRLWVLPQMLDFTQHKSHHSYEGSHIQTNNLLTLLLSLS